MATVNQMHKIGDHWIDLKGNVIPDRKVTEDQKTAYQMTPGKHRRDWQEEMILDQKSRTNMMGWLHPLTGKLYQVEVVKRISNRSFRYLPDRQMRANKHEDEGRLMSYRVKLNTEVSEGFFPAVWDHDTSRVFSFFPFAGEGKFSWGQSDITKKFDPSYWTFIYDGWVNSLTRPPDGQQIFTKRPRHGGKILHYKDNDKYYKVKYVYGGWWPTEVSEDELSWPVLDYDGNYALVDTRTIYYKSFYEVSTWKYEDDGKITNIYWEPGLAYDGCSGGIELWDIKNNKKITTIWKMREPTLVDYKATIGTPTGHWEDASEYNDDKIWVLNDDAPTKIYKTVASNNLSEMVVTASISKGKVILGTTQKSNVIRETPPGSLAQYTGKGAEWTITWETRKQMTEWIPFFTAFYRWGYGGFKQNYRLSPGPGLGFNINIIPGMKPGSYEEFNPKYSETHYEYDLRYRLYLYDIPSHKLQEVKLEGLSPLGNVGHFTKNADFEIFLSSWGHLVYSTKIEVEDHKISKGSLEYFLDGPLDLSKPIRCWGNHGEYYIIERGEPGPGEVLIRGAQSSYATRHSGPGIQTTWQKGIENNYVNNGICRHNAKDAPDTVYWEYHTFKPVTEDHLDEKTYRITFGDEYDPTRGTFSNYDNPEDVNMGWLEFPIYKTWFELTKPRFYSPDTPEGLYITGTTGELQPVGWHSGAPIPRSCFVVNANSGLLYIPLNYVEGNGLKRKSRMRLYCFSLEPEGNVLPARGYVTLGKYSDWIGYYNYKHVHCQYNG